MRSDPVNRMTQSAADSRAVRAAADPPERRLIVALDMDAQRNRRLVEDLGDLVSFYKFGSISLLDGGAELLDELLARGKDVFLDLKIFDVPNTVEQTVAKVAQLGVRFATVHGTTEIIESAARGRGDSNLEILAVTALTSLTARDVREVYGLPDGLSLDEYVVARAKALSEAGCDGVIASPREVKSIRESVITPGGSKLLIVAPGIRMPDDSQDDQVRIGCPYESIRDGADYLVMGRSIYRADDPVRKAELVIEEIRNGLNDRGS